MTIRSITDACEMHAMIRITTSIGVRNTFGSISNTIVNQRFRSLGSSGGRFSPRI